MSTHKPAPFPSESEITLVTQGSWNRHSHLLFLASRWNGPISVSILIDSMDNLKDLSWFINNHSIIQKYVSIHIVRKSPLQPMKIKNCGIPIDESVLNKIFQTKLLTDVEMKKLTIYENEYIYDCFPTCVGFSLSKNKFCAKEKFVCRSGGKMGELKHQLNDVRIAITTKVYRHPNCPITEQQYPINLLRNIALQNVQTQWIMNVDIDLIPSSCMKFFLQDVKAAQEKAITSQKSSKNECKGLLAFVIPAFEINSENLTILSKVTKPLNFESSCKIIPKQTLLLLLLKYFPEKINDNSINRNVVKPMHRFYPPAYGPTNYRKWIFLRENEEIYKTNYVIRFEPYYITKLPIPMFENDFVDRGGNFAQQVLEMNAGGYEFYVLRSSFVIDVSHSNKTTQRTNNHPLSDALWKNFYEKIQKRYGIILPAYKGPKFKETLKKLENTMQMN